VGDGSTAWSILCLQLKKCNGISAIQGTSF
jgi:hypothetical protein